MIVKRLILVSVALLCILAFLLSRQTTPPVAVPVIDTTGLHALVVTAIEKGIFEVHAHPDVAESWGQLGMILLAHDYAPEARECLRSAAELAPADFRWPYFSGYSFEGTSYEQALAHYQAALKLLPAYVPVRLRTATILLRLGRVEECDQLLSVGQQLTPNDPFLTLTFGRLRLMQNDFANAQEFFEAASKMPNWMPQQAFMELAKLAMRTGNYEQALEYQRKLQAFPELARLEFDDPVLQGIRQYEGLSKSLAETADLALARGDVSSAILAYESFVKKRTDLPNAFTNLAQAYAMGGRNADAIEVYQHVLDQFGPSIRAHIGLAGISAAQGNLEQAIVQYRAALDIKPDHKHVWLYLGSLYEQLANEAEALRCYRQSAAIDPSFPQAQLAIGIVLLKQGPPESARPYFQRAAQLAPGEELPQAYLRMTQ